MCPFVQRSCAWLMNLGSSCRTRHCRSDMNQDSAITWPISRLKCCQKHFLVEYEGVYE
uniref:Uncharacterized protein n=1 Tax=Anguilla anguilla TaxID=7936 RepID=A0A0E9TRG3_ANGAN